MTWVRMLGLGCFVVVALPARAADQVATTTMTIRLISTTTYADVLTDRAPTKEASRGDLIVIGSTLRNAVAQFGRPKGALVGEDTASFELRSHTRADLVVESDLPGGGLRAAGRVRLGYRQTYSVTGGHGSFRHARGSGESVALVREGQGHRRLVVYRLVLP